MSLFEISRAWMVLSQGLGILVDFVTEESDFVKYLQSFHYKSWKDFSLENKPQLGKTLSNTLNWAMLKGGNLTRNI